MADLPPYIRLREGGCSIVVKVHPRARRQRLAAVHAGALKLEVTSAPERGAANRAVESLLAAALGVAPREVEVVRGRGAREKVVGVRGVTPEVAAARLAAALAHR